MFNKIIEDFSPKWKTKNQKQKSITKPIKKNYKKDCKTIIEIFLKMEKSKKEMMLTIEIKIHQIRIEKEKKEYMRNDYYKRKNLLNHLIICVEELEKVSHYKWIWSLKK